MKKLTKNILGVLFILLIVAITTYFLSNKAPKADLAASKQVITILESGECISCHSEQPKLPFYAQFPIIGELVKKDAQNGWIQFDLSNVYFSLKKGQSISEIDLAKLEQIARSGSMPPMKYYLVHWGSALNCAEKEMVIKWAQDYRQNNYSNQLASSEFTKEMIQPIRNNLPTVPEKVNLGKLLYNDVRLSVDNSISCASCHNLSTGGVDNKTYSEGVNGQFGGVNAPTVYNAAFNFVQFWDGRAATLAAQAAGPPLNPIEMGSSSFDQIIEKLQADEAFSNLFLSTYPEGYSEATITNAIEEYEKTLLTPNSRFDQYLKGDKQALTADETAGYELFKTNQCATCHAGENMGGLSYERWNYVEDYLKDRNTELNEDDYGRYKQTKNRRDMYRFKVPTLRNIALTAPYLHDGTKSTLTNAVNTMATYHLGKSAMTEQEILSVTAFLESLTGEYNGVSLKDKQKLEAIHSISK